MSCLPYLIIFLCVLALEVGWVWSVRSVAAGRELTVVTNAIVMQAISNLCTLILVHDSWTSVASVMGAGAGALIGMRVTLQRQTAE